MKLRKTFEIGVSKMNGSSFLFEFLGLDNNYTLAEFLKVILVIKIIEYAII